MPSSGAGLRKRHRLLRRGVRLLTAALGLGWKVNKFVECVYYNYYCGAMGLTRGGWVSPLSAFTS